MPNTIQESSKPITAKEQATNIRWCERNLMKAIKAHHETDIAEYIRLIQVWDAYATEG